MNQEQAHDLLQRLVSRVDRVIVGKKREIELAVVAMLYGGHILLEDVPGVGKTMLVRTLAACLGGSFGRIQFTSDLMPSDVTGVTVYHAQSGQFEFRPGPVFSHIVLADEINRAAPRTQSALLEAMEERKVTVDGVTRALPKPFLLLATQNPLEYEGTYRLPEAQLDRFLMRLALGYPNPEQELEMLGRLQEQHPLAELKPVLLPDEIAAMQRQVRSVLVDDVVKRYMVSLADASRRHPQVSLGISPRGTLAWMGASQAMAYFKGRSFVTPDDVKAVAEAVLVHRIVLKPKPKSPESAANGCLGNCSLKWTCRFLQGSQECRHEKRDLEMGGGPDGNGAAHGMVFMARRRVFFLFGAAVLVRNAARRVGIMVRSEAHESGALLGAGPSGGRGWARHEIDRDLSKRIAAAVAACGR